MSLSMLSGCHVVADTSSLLINGTKLLGELPECELIIPTVVIKELEEKRSDQRLGFLARQWLRLCEEARVEIGRDINSEGYDFSDNVVIRIETNHSSQDCLPPSFRDGSVDSTILSIVHNLKKDGTENVSLLSNDLPMRIYATTILGVDAVEYSSSFSRHVQPFHGTTPVDLTEEQCAAYYETDDKEFFIENLVKAYSYYSYVPVVFGGKIIDSYLYSDGDMIRLRPHSSIFGKVSTKSLEQEVAYAYLHELPEDLPIVSLGGKAGTGKTLLALASGIELVVKDGEYDKITIFRSLHEMGVGQEMGFLPGTVEEKMSPWGGAIQDALDVLGLSGNSSVTDKIDILPVTYLRGRSLSRHYIIIEEAQNFSTTEILNILSRVGDGSKVVLTFDAAQVDNRFLQSGDGADVWTVVDMLKNNPLFAHITLHKTERSAVSELASELLEHGDY